eukprot:5102140-Pyramimonas_sp.AAC.1
MGLAGTAVRASSSSATCFRLGQSSSPSSVRAPARRDVLFDGAAAQCEAPAGRSKKEDYTWFLCSSHNSTDD